MHWSNISSWTYLTTSECQSRRHSRRSRRRDSLSTSTDRCGARGWSSAIFVEERMPWYSSSFRWFSGSRSWYKASLGICHTLVERSKNERWKSCTTLGKSRVNGNVRSNQVRRREGYGIIRWWAGTPAGLLIARHARFMVTVSECCYYHRQRSLRSCWTFTKMDTSTSTTI